MTSPVYALARNVRGFRTSTIRVRIERLEGGYAWVRTASLQDAGTPLVLDRSQIELEEDMWDDELRHTAGMVVLA